MTLFVPIDDTLYVAGKAISFEEYAQLIRNAQAAYERGTPTRRQQFDVAVGTQTWTNTTGGPVVLYALLRGAGGGRGGSELGTCGNGGAGAVKVYAFIVADTVSVTITVGGVGADGATNGAGESSGGGGGSGTRLVHGGDTYVAGGGGGGGGDGNVGAGGGAGGVAGSGDTGTPGGAAGTNAITTNGGTPGAGSGAADSPPATSGGPGTGTAGDVAQEFFFRDSETTSVGATLSNAATPGLCVLRW